MKMIWQRRSSECRVETVSDSATLYLTPSSDIYETGDAFVISADIPGVDEKGADVSLKGNQLVIIGRIAGETQEPAFGSGRHFAGAYRRCFRIPGNVDRKRVSADLEDGVLRITLPKLGAKRSMHIPVVQG
jgi:HSP20 family protein